MEYFAGRGDLAEGSEPEGSNAPKLAGQIETASLVLRYHAAAKHDREEKRVTYGKG